MCLTENICCVQRFNQPIYMRPPRDPVQKIAKTFLHELYAVVGSLYGFSNAPKTWTDHVSNTLIRKSKLKRHRLDHMCFYGVDEKGYLEIILICHVDDFLIAYREDYCLGNVTDHFTWGSQTTLTTQTPIQFRGKHINLVERDNHFEILVNQTDFIKEMADGKLPKGRLREETVLTANEWKEYRSCAGSLQWLAGQSRPDVCSTVSLSNKGQETAPRDLDQLYQCIQAVKETKELGIWYYPVNFDKAMFIVGYGDSSWANAHLHKSQMGVLVVLTTPTCLEIETRCTIVDWKSTRSPRVTRSTLASEANAMDECVDRATYVNHFVTEILYDKAMGYTRKLRQLQITDCKSLYDAVLSPQPSLTEKRTIISVRSIQDFIHPKDLWWTPTSVMHADVLTKSSTELIAHFQLWMEKPTVLLVAKENKDQCEFHEKAVIEHCT